MPGNRCLRLPGSSTQHPLLTLITHQNDSSLKNGSGDVKPLELGSPICSDRQDEVDPERPKAPTFIQKRRFSLLPLVGALVGAVHVTQSLA